jgi:DNA-binding cell septation regulator SpoVG
VPAFEAGPVRLVENAGALNAYLSVKIGSLAIHKFRVIQQPGRAPWVSVPQETWTDPQTGERRFTNLLELPREWRQPLTHAVIAAWRDELQKQQQEGNAE